MSITERKTATGRSLVLGEVELDLDDSDAEDGYVPVYDAAGRKLRLGPGGGGGGSAFDVLYQLAGEAHDYTEDPAWTSAETDYPDNDGGAAVTDLLGDGVDAPRFWVLNKNLVVACESTGDGWLRVTHATVPTSAAAGYPADTNSAALVIPLPPCAALAVDLVLRHNGPSVDSGSWTGARVVLVDGKTPTTLASVRARSDAGVDNQTLDCWATAEASPGSVDDSAFVASGVFQRIYRLEWRGPLAAVYGGDPGASVVGGRLRGKRDGAQGIARHATPALVVSFIRGTDAIADQYFELALLRIAGNRSPF